MTRRLLLTYLTFALLILVALEVPLAYAEARNEQQQAFERLEHDAEVLASFVDSALSNGDMPQVDVLAHESAVRLRGQVDIVDAHGNLLSSTRRPGDAAVSGSDIRAVLDGQGRVSTRTEMHAGVQIMSVAVSVHPGLAPHGVMRVSVPTDTMRAAIRRFQLILMAAGLLVLAIAGVIALALAQWISRPVRALEQATRTLADGTSPAPLPTTTGPPELRRLAVTFKATGDRLHGLIASQRSFVGHASHQLKTPLAALRLRLENLEPDIAPAGGKNLQAALTETDRLARMVESLLTMARSEQTALPREPVGLAETVADRLSFWTPLADSRGVRLVPAGPAEAGVLAVPGAVDQIIDNLLSNALRVAPNGSTVQVAWRPAPASQEASMPEGSRAREGSMMELHVVDEGPGLTTAQRVSAFDPFWRAPGFVADGTGLGLALVRKLAEASGGQAILAPAATNGIDAIVTLPTDPARQGTDATGQETDPARQGTDPAQQRTGPAGQEIAPDRQDGSAAGRELGQAGGIGVGHDLVDAP